MERTNEDAEEKVYNYRYNCSIEVSPAVLLIMVAGEANYHVKQTNNRTTKITHTHAESNIIMHILQAEFFIKFFIILHLTFPS